MLEKDDAEEKTSPEQPLEDLEEFQELIDMLGEDDTEEKTSPGKFQF